MVDELMIDVRGLEHAYRRGSVTEPVLRGLDLQVRRGEFVVIMGPSGCGKTTLLNVLGLMLTPTRVEGLRIAGQDTRGLNDAQRTRLRREALGFVFQRFNLLPTITVRRNVALPLRIRGARAGNGTSAGNGTGVGQVRGGGDGVMELLERVGLSACADKKPGQLSVGQQQRVAIARAVIAGPALLLADEPTGNLDSANADAVLALLGALHRENGQTIVMITHNEQLAVQADRVLRMRDGCFVG